jgi:type I phosphodiesterase/nucleotide pyrophosphatase
MPRLDIHPGTGGLLDVLPGALAATGAPFADPLGLADELNGVRRVGVLLVDGFGFHQLATAAEVGPTLADIHGGHLGKVRPLRCGFPSTTPVSLVGIGTAKPPGAHGIVGFAARVPETGRVLNHIRWGDDPSPSSYQPEPTVFERAARLGIDTVVVSKPEFEGSGLTRAAYRGSLFRGASDRYELINGMVGALNDGVRLVYGYHADLDYFGHGYGVGSDEWRDAARGVDQLVTMLAARMPRDSALLVTADHGQINIGADRKFDMDTDDALGDGIDAVAGEARVRYLYTRAGATDDVLATWRQILGPAAEVRTRDEAIAAGWWGPVTPAHAARIGDVVAVCHGDYAVVRSKSEPGEAGLVGYHGSYTPAEVDVPLIVIRGDR